MVALHRTYRFSVCLQDLRVIGEQHRLASADSRFPSEGGPCCTHRTRRLAHNLWNELLSVVKSHDRAKVKDVWTFEDQAGRYYQNTKNR